MEHELNKDLLILGISRIKIFVSHSGGNLTQLSEMLRHVSFQDSLDNDVPRSLEVIFVHIDGPVACTVFFHNLERGR